MAGSPADRVDVFELAQRGGELRLQVPIAALPRLAAAVLDAEGGLQCGFTGRQGERGPAADLAVDGTVRLRCDRCGEPVEVPIRERASFFFVADEEELQRLPIDESPDEPLAGSREFDLIGLIEEQVLLVLPISPRHEGCSTPGAGHGKADPQVRRPFEVLAGFKPRRH